MKAIVVTWIGFCCCCSVTLAQLSHTPESTPAFQTPEDSVWLAPRYQYEPWPLDVGTSLWTFGLSLSILPQPVVESEVPAPALEAQYKRGLFDEVTFGASLSTNVVSNVLQIGLQWNDRVNHFSYALGANAAVFYGWLSIEGQFDKNWAYAFAALPVVRLGYRFSEFSFSSSFAATIVLDGQTHIGSLRAQGTSSPLNDIFMTLAVEQPFLTSSYVSLGLSLTYSRTPYQSWILFNTLDQFLLIPEVFVGFQL